MVSGLEELVTGQQIASWLIIAFLILYFIYKEYPELKRRISKTAVKEKTDEISGKTLEERLTNMEKTMGEINDKLGRDYERINNLEREYLKTQNAVRDTKEEQGIILRALLSVIEGLQQLGANGLTKESEKEINEYLIQKAHSKESI